MAIMWKNLKSSIGGKPCVKGSFCSGRLRKSDSEQRIEDEFKNQLQSNQGRLLFSLSKSSMHAIYILAINAIINVISRGKDFSTRRASQIQDNLQACSRLMHFESHLLLE